MSREVLAQDAATKLAAAQIRDARCAGAGRRWSELEVQHRVAGHPDAARAVIDHVRSEYCGGCPARALCARWAETQQYTGLAAGAAYEVGDRQRPAWAAPRPGRARAS